MLVLALEGEISLPRSSAPSARIRIHGVHYCRGLEEPEHDNLTAAGSILELAKPRSNSG